MRVCIASDHAGFCQKPAMIRVLCDLGCEVDDFGCTSEESVDYPDFAHRVAKGVSSGAFEYGVLICGTGLGMSLAANKHKGVRAVPVQTPGFATLAREHNDANVLCLSARFVSEEMNAQLIRTFLQTEFLGEQHARRVAKIDVE